MIFPVVGPVFAFGADGSHWAMANLWPDTPTPVRPPHRMVFDGITPRNCMPSLHTAWATTIFIHSRKGPRPLRAAGSFWLVATLTATLGFGYHYGADLVAGAVFALTVETAMRALDRGWDLSASLLVARGTTVFVALLLSYRYLPMEMAGHPWLFGPLLVLALASVVLPYVQTTKRWDQEPAAQRSVERRPTGPRPEPA
jgi:hypothetical protein